jgi:hypothetical protein
MREVFLALIFSLPAFGAPVISEFMASNETTLADEDGEFSDWIEVFNPDDEPVDLGGYYLTDNALTLNRWEFPATTLGAGEWLVVFASGKDRDVGELHPDFKLAAEGEYLALVAPDGTTVVSDFGERYPPQSEDKSYGGGGFGTGYFDEATPGAANSDGRIPGPQFGEVRTGGDRPSSGEMLTITASVTGAEDVTLFFRAGDSDEQVVAMTSGDGENFSVTIPSAFAGQLVRWRFVAQDVDGRVSKEPPFNDPTDSHEYHGVPVLNPLVETNAELVEWFISPADYNRLTSFQTVRAGVYFLGEYYDNVRFSLHGQSSLFFDKKSFNMDFNKTQRFRWKEGESRVKDLDLLTNWGDKSKSRNEIAFEIMRESGVPTHFAKTIRLQQNGEFFSLADMVEDADDRYLKRAGLNPDGALFKAIATSLNLSDLEEPFPLSSRARKMTRKDGDYQDLSRFIRGINADGADRWDYIFDNVDLPMTINTLAGLIVIMQTDMYDKNYYIYRDTGGDNEWAILPWDLDLSLGRDFTDRAGYFDTNLFAMGYTEHEESADVVSLVESLIDGNSATRAMFFRRVRTLSDRFIASDYLNERTLQQLERLSPADIFPTDATLDSFKWGTWYDGSPVPKPFSTTHPDSESMSRAVTRLVSEWLPLRRFELYENTRDLPAAQINPSIMIGALDFDPISDDQDQEYLELINQSPTATDISGWGIRGAITFTLPPGTVIPAGGTLYLSPNKKAFRVREISPTGNEQRFVVGPYEGHLAAEGETLELYDENEIIRDSKTYSGSNPGFNGDSREDQDRDGLNAILEWALGSSDLVPGGLNPPVPETFTYSVRSDLNGFSLVVEVSPDLANWVREGVVELDRVSQSATLDRVTVQLPHTETRCFVRLVLERQ